MAGSWASGTAFEPTHVGLISPQQTSPTATSPGDESSARKRKRSSVAIEQHVDSAEVGGAALRGVSAGSPTTLSPSAGGKPRHQPGVKRACNDCRQQKLRCNVQAGPGEAYTPCDRCVKHGLKCSIDNDFKRLGKRAQHEEMAKELEQCKAKLARYEAMGIHLPDETPRTETTYTGSYQASPVAGAPVAPMGAGASTFLGASEAAASRSLLDLSQGYRESAPTNYPNITPGTSLNTLGPVTLTETQILDLYRVYWEHYHPFLPVLNHELDYKHYYAEHVLLHWTIVVMASRRYDARPGLFIELQRPLEELLWTTLSGVPQHYHVCKALALLCTWPMPGSSTSVEPTMMLCGTMFQLAMQYGLHRPSHAQDFSRFRVDLREEDIADRLNTWATVNIVAQNVATGNGQPPLARWAWFTYGLHLDRMKPQLRTRCLIEKFCDTVTRTLYTMQRDHVVEVDQAQRGLQIDMYSRELGELEVTVLSTSNSRKSAAPNGVTESSSYGDAAALEVLFLKAASLHLRLTAFFDKPHQPNYMADLRNVYIAAAAMVEHLDGMPLQQFSYVPRYIEQMMLAAACVLLKILNSFYALHVDNTHGRTLFFRTVACLRKLSVRSNDLPQRLAEVMAQLWQSSEAGGGEQKLFKDETPSDDTENLQLKVRCRSSLSVLYDAIWRWRERAGQAGRDSLAQAVEHPTTLPGDTHTRSTPQPLNGLSDGIALPSNGIDLGGHGGGLGSLGDWDSPFGGNAVFDPLSWALDGNLGMQGLFGGQDTLGMSFQT